MFIIWMISSECWPTSTRKLIILRLAVAYTSSTYFTTHLVHWKLSLPNVPRLYSDITVPRLFRRSDFWEHICKGKRVKIISTIHRLYTKAKQDWTTGMHTSLHTVTEVMETNCTDGIIEMAIYLNNMVGSIPAPLTWIFVVLDENWQ